MNNDTMKGYIVMTLKNCGYTIDEIRKILGELDFLQDIKTESEVENYYIEGIWQM